jgi:hypothetical protein
LSLLLLGCQHGDRDLETLERACDDGDFSACDTVVAHYELGVDVDPDKEHAARVRRRTLFRRMTACAKSVDDDDTPNEACSELPGELADLAGDGTMPREDAITGVVGIELLEDGTIRFDAGTVTEAQLAARAKAACATPKRIVIRADKSVDHGRVIAMVDQLRGAGCRQLSLGATPFRPAP